MDYHYHYLPRLEFNERRHEYQKVKYAEAKARIHATYSILTLERGIREHDEKIATFDPNSTLADRMNIMYDEVIFDDRDGYRIRENYSFNKDADTWTDLIKEVVSYFKWELAYNIDTNERIDDADYAKL